MNKYSSQSPLKIWIFCAVIDNFGDAGVAYRLARLLKENHNWQITLWIDELSTLACLENKLSSTYSSQWIHGIHIVLWQQTTLKTTQTIPQVIIETFGCFSTHPLEITFATRPLHINLEYLSLEPWTLDCHLKPSLGYANKFFYFLGVTPQSGGLLIEKNYLKSEALFKHRQVDYSNSSSYTFTHFARADSHNFSVLANVKHAHSNLKKVFLFGYESPYWEKWFSLWDRLGFKYELWVVQDKVLNSLTEKRLSAKHTRLIPFINQTIFDEILWSVDIAIVRGEDSFVRAQLAGLPFFWHAYPQEGNAHLIKLNAFLNHVRLYYPANIYQTWKKLILDLNGNFCLDNHERTHYFRLLWAEEEKWRLGTLRWKNFLLSQSTAGERLTCFIKKKLE